MNKKYNYEIVHDNLNDQWFLVDLSNKKYKFYSKIKNFNYKIYSNPQFDKFNEKKSNQTIHI
jgi:hypothetical protein